MALLIGSPCLGVCTHCDPMAGVQSAGLALTLGRRLPLLLVLLAPCAVLVLV